MLIFVKKYLTNEISLKKNTLYKCKAYHKRKNKEMLAAYCNSNDENSNCAKLLGLATTSHEGGLICDCTNLISDNTSLLSTALANGGMDSCSFYDGPSDETIFAFGESAESCGSIAYGESCESCGSIAFSGGCESASVSSSSGVSSGGGCSYSC